MSAPDPSTELPSQQPNPTAVAPVNQPSPEPPAVPAAAIKPANPRKTEKKPSVNGRRLAQWTPAPQWAHPVEAVLYAYLASWTVLLGVPWWGLAATAPLLAFAGWARARRRWPAVDYGEGLALGMAWVHVVAGVTAGAWMGYAAWRGTLTSVGWLLLAGSLLGIWYGILYVKAPVAAAEVDRIEAEAEVRKAAATWVRIFKDVGLTVEIIRSESTRAGYVLAVKAPEGAKVLGIDDLRAKVRDLTTTASAALASTGVAVRAGDIRVEPTDLAHVHLVHVLTKHVLGQTITYEPFGNGPATITDPLTIGLYEDGQPVELTFDGKAAAHTLAVGGTGSGKSTLTNALIGRVGECGDVAVGVVATDKLVPLVYPWLRPWLAGDTDRPALDFVAGQNIDHVLDVLAELYKVMRERNAKLAGRPAHVATPVEPAIVIVMEEAGDLCRRPNKITTYDGQQMTVSRLLWEFTRSGRSALVHVVVLNQDALIDFLGEFGSEIMRNLVIRVALKTLSAYDGRAVLPGLSGNVDTTTLRDWSMLVQPSVEQPRVMPAKSEFLEGDAIHPVATANASWRPVPAWGGVWLDRWNPERHPELVDAARADGLTWPGMAPAAVSSVDEDRPDGIRDEWDEGLDALLAQDQPTRGEGHPPAPAVEVKPGEAIAGGDDAINAINAATANLGKARKLPEPLAAVMALLEREGAPTDWVATRDLAVGLGRITEDAEEVELRKSAQQLGRELAANHAGIRSEARNRVQGYSVKLLRRAATSIAKGETP